MSVLAHANQNARNVINLLSAWLRSFSRYCPILG
jgi:hypothetical protein